MSTDHTLPLTSHQQSDVEAASDALYAEAAEEIVEQGSGLDSAAILALAAIGILFNVLSPELRTTSPLGLAFRDPALRRVVTLILGFMAVTRFVGEKIRQRDTGQRIAGGLLAPYTLNTASLTFRSLDPLTATLL